MGISIPFYLTYKKCILDFPSTISRLFVGGQMSSAKKKVCYPSKHIRPDGQFLKGLNACAIFKHTAWEQFRDLIPESERGSFVEAYRKRLNSDDKEIQVRLSSFGAFAIYY